MNTEEILPLPRKSELLEAETCHQIRFFCDRCHEAYLSAELPLEEVPDGQALQRLMIEQMHSLFYRCPQCKLWVCRENCWEPIQCACEGCARGELPQSEVSTAPNAKAQSLYSSILGSVCPGCQMVLPPNATSCPECGQKL